MDEQQRQHKLDLEEQLARNREENSKLYSENLCCVIQKLRLKGGLESF